MVEKEKSKEEKLTDALKSTAFQFPNDYKLKYDGTSVSSCQTVCKFNLQLTQRVQPPQQLLQLSLN